MNTDNGNTIMQRAPSACAAAAPRPGAPGRGRGPTYYLYKACCFLVIVCSFLGGRPRCSIIHSTQIKL